MGQSHSDSSTGLCCAKAMTRGVWASSDRLRDPSEFRMAEIAQSVERFDRDWRLGVSAIGGRLCQRLADDAFVATDGGFRQRPSVVAAPLLPVHTPVRLKRENMLVASVRRSRGGWPSHRSVAGRNGVSGVRTSGYDCVAHGGWVIGALPMKGNNLAAVGVNDYKKLAPRAALHRSTFFKQPFATSAQRKPAAIDDQGKLTGIRRWQS